MGFLYNWCEMWYKAVNYIETPKKKYVPAKSYTYSQVIMITLLMPCMLIGVIMSECFIAFLMVIITPVKKIDKYLTEHKVTRD